MSRIKKGKSPFGNKPRDYIFRHPTTIITYLPNEFEAEAQEVYH
jgi:hypothetical protein